MKATLTGIITDIFPSEVYNSFEKRVFWLKQPDTEQYPQHWAIELWGEEDGKRLNSFAVGDQVIAKVDIRGRKWSKNGRSGCMVSLKCWSLEKVGAQKPPPSTRQQTGGIPAVNNEWKPANEGGEDLPF